MKATWTVAVALLAAGWGAAGAEPWKRHTIDDSTRGADGTRLADVNGDGRPDIATGWEEGGQIRVCINPGTQRVKEKWPAVTVGNVESPEDAVMVDVDGDGDGAMDVVSCCEGDTKAVFVHWGPKNRAMVGEAGAWRTEALPASVGVTRWMFCAPMQVDGKHGVDLVCGSKDPDGQIGWFEAPADGRRLGEWRYHPLRPAGWIMSLLATDMDGDGDLDLLFSDRYGPRRGVYWLENAGAGQERSGGWKEHAVGAAGREAMFLVETDLDRDGLRDIVVAVKPRELVWLRRRNAAGKQWTESTIRMPEVAGRAKGVAAGDVDGDGRMDLVFSCEGAEDRPGVMWLSYQREPGEQEWVAHDISGKAGVKYDLVELLDLDGDGDLDVLTSEERELNAVIWYENPLKAPTSP